MYYVISVTVYYSVPSHSTFFQLFILYLDTLWSHNQPLSNYHHGGPCKSYNGIQILS